MSKYKYDPYDYLNMQELKYAKRYEEKDLRKAYTYFRDIAKKRIERLETYGYTKGAQYQRIKAMGMPYLKDIDNRNNLAMYLRQIAYFVTLEQSTVTGIKRIRKQKIEWLQQQGYNQINSNNYEEFVEFMEEAKAKSGKFYDMDGIYKMYKYAKKQKIPVKDIENNFTWWQDNIENVEQMRIPKNEKKPHSTAEVKKMMKKKE